MFDFKIIAPQSKNAYTKEEFYGDAMRTFFSLELLSSAMCKDSAAQPLEIGLYACRHLDGRLTVHTETVDPDWFPGTPADFVLARQDKLLTKNEAILKARADALMEEAVREVCRVRGAHVVAEKAPAPSLLRKVVNMADENRVLVSNFWGRLYTDLHRETLKPGGRNVSPVQDNDAAQLASKGVRADKAKAVAWVLSDFSESMQDGLREAARFAYEHPEQAWSGLRQLSRSAVLMAIDTAKEVPNSPLSYTGTQFMHQCGVQVLTCLSDRP